jgi:hypothetical protein
LFKDIINDENFFNELSKLKLNYHFKEYSTRILKSFYFVGFDYNNKTNKPFLLFFSSEYDSLFYEEQNKTNEPFLLFFSSEYDSLFYEEKNTYI